MNNQLIRTVEKYKMLKNGDSVVVALSGGADSVALLDILNSIKEKYNFTLYAVHVNHGLRGEESLRDENFCKLLCEKYGIRLFVRQENVSELAKKNKNFALADEIRNKITALGYSILDTREGVKVQKIK